MRREGAVIHVVVTPPSLKEHITLHHISFGFSFISIQYIKLKDLITLLLRRPYKEMDKK